MKILLLGATGYLGSNIARYFAKSGDKVFCVVRQTSDITILRGINNIELISTDLCQIELTIKHNTIDWIVNGVCTYKPNGSLYGDMFESNIIFPLNVLNIAIKHGVKNFITMGTGLPEDFNMYSFTKAKFSEFGKFLSEKDSINFAELRLEMFYGGYNEPENRFLNNCKIKLAKGEPLDLTDGTQKRDIVRVEDILGLIKKIMSFEYVKGYQILPIGSGENHSIREIIEFMKSEMKSESKLNFGKVPSRVGEPDTLADITWYSKVDYKLKFSYFDGIKDACLRTRMINV